MIYKELTDMHNAKSGSVAKHYYERFVFVLLIVY